ncbi:CS1-pili formation C-terminal domain-containing protein [Serratia liquefaciens]|uniref:CS1-pili formation C-terminal domain-containing protein n=1 Tax=Serratia liquefaciens TaxID=614 RepID=UPI0015A250C4|nr:CS1-pili formation C-terminal domain-containing protein [Serratia liquefaciens]NWA19892.1 CS1-pili formation C-terminal domain-containing protein [Serratia liquefaciens]
MDDVLLKTLLAAGALVLPAVLLPGQTTMAARLTQIDGVLIPQTFSLALREGMSIPLLLHFEKNSGVKDDRRIGHAFLYLENDQLKIRQITLEEGDEGTPLTAETIKQLQALQETAFDRQQRIALTPDAWLALDFRQLNLQLVVKASAMGTLLRARSSDIGTSSVNAVSSTLDYNLGIYDNRTRASEGNTSSYLSLNSVTALREHHVEVNGSIYGIGSGDENATLYKAMYERDFAGRRFAAGMLDSWNLQSLGPVTTINSSKIYGLSYGNRANSTVFDNSQSLTPIVAFFPSAGEVHLSREGRLLSVQNFAMGNHEVDTGNLPYGIYDVEVEVVVNGKVVDKRMQRVNKLFSPNRGANAPLAWQFWGGMIRMDDWRGDNQRQRPAKDSYLLGASATGNVNRLNWALSGYSFDSNAVGESRISVPLTESIQFNLQNMAASDSSWSMVNSVSAALPGGFSSVWINQEKTSIGDKLLQNDAYNRAIGGTMNFGALWSPLGSLSLSYNDDKKNNSHYYNADYYQNVFTGRFGTLGVRTGIQRYNNGGYSANTGKYIALDFSLPMGNWLSAGVSNQNGYTTANLAARKDIQNGPIRTLGANLSRAISGDTNGDNSLNGGAYARFDTKYSAGTVNVSSSADGYVNSSLSASGSVGWQGRDIAASGRSEGNAGIIFNTGIENDGMLTARVDGRTVKLTGNKNYVPLSPYGQYEVELMNNKNSAESFDIVTKRKSKLTLYPGNVAVITPEIKQMVTVFGRIKAEDGTLLANAYIKNHIGRTRTDDKGEFIMDVDKKFPVIDFTHSGNQSCEVDLDLSKAQGAVWVGDVVCTGLKTYAGNNMQAGETINEG